MLASQQHRQAALTATQRSTPCSSSLRFHGKASNGAAGSVSQLALYHGCYLFMQLSGRHCPWLRNTPCCTSICSHARESSGAARSAPHLFLAINTADLAAAQANGTYGQELESTLPLSTLNLARYSKLHSNKLDNQVPGNTAFTIFTTTRRIVIKIQNHKGQNNQPLPFPIN